MTWARRVLGVALVIGTGVVHVAQPPDLGAAVTARLQTVDPLSLAALHVVTTLTGSALLALALAYAELDADAAWKAAHVDEDFQIEQWGWDAEASARREAREREMRAAATILKLLPPPA